MRIFREEVNTLVIGLFLLLSTVFWYSMFGVSGKYLTLFSGFIILVSLLRRFDKNKASLRYAVFLIFYFVILYGIGFLNNHKIIDEILLVFAFVVFFLNYFGYLLANNLSKLEEPSIKLMILISIVTIICCVQYLSIAKSYYQIEEVSRSIEVSLEQNPVAISFLMSLLFLLKISFLTVTKKSLLLRVLVVVSLILIFNVIITTLSRGAIMFLAIVIMLFFFKRKNIFRLLLVLGGVGVLVHYLIEYFPFINDKLSLLTERFSSFLSVVGNKRINLDQSSLDRVNFYKDFYENIDDFILIGKYGYEVYPHNLFLEIILRWGFLGVPLFVYVCYNFIKMIKIVINGRINEYSYVNRLFFAFFLFCFLQSMTSLSIEMNRILWLSSGFIYGLKK